MPPTITGAAIPLTFADGTTYQASPFSDRDIDELDEYVRHVLIRNARQSCRDADVTPEEAQRIESTALEMSISITWMSGVGARLMSQPRGMARLVWQSVKHNHPDVTEDQIHKQLLDPENVRAANSTFAQANIGTSRRPAKGKARTGRTRRPASKSTGR